MRYKHFFCSICPTLLLCLSVLTSRTMGARATKAEYKDFGRDVTEVITKAKEVAVGDREQSDVRALAFLLRNYNEAVATKNWRQADLVKERMQVYLMRSSAVAADAQKRKADLKRADEERRHREWMRQQERQHQELMRQLRR